MRASAILVLLALSSCTAADPSFLNEDAQKIQVGVSDRKAVDAMLGAPTFWTSRGASEEIWVYTRAATASSGPDLGKIPLVGEALFVEPFPSAKRADGAQITIVFVNNIVRSCKIVVKSPSGAARETINDCKALSSES